MFGLDLGTFRTDGVGASYIGRFTHSSGTTEQTYNSEALAFATYVTAIICPASSVGAHEVRTYPTVSTSLTNGQATITAVGGDVTVDILVFMG